MVHLLSFSLSGPHDLGPGILWVKCDMFITLSTSPTALEINGWHQPAQTWIGESTETINKAGNGQMSEIGRDGKSGGGRTDKCMDKQANEEDSRETRDGVEISGCNSNLTANLALKFLHTKKSSKASLHHVTSTESDGNYSSTHLPRGKNHKL